MAWCLAIFQPFWKCLIKCLMDLRLHYLRPTRQLLKAQFISRRLCELALLFIYLFIFNKEYFVRQMEDSERNISNRRGIKKKSLFFILSKKGCLLYFFAQEGVII